MSLVTVAMSGSARRARCGFPAIVEDHDSIAPDVLPVCEAESCKNVV